MILDVGIFSLTYETIDDASDILTAINYRSFPQKILKKIKNYVSNLLTKKSDKEITKKNILIGFLTSPFVMLIIANILYGLTLINLYKNKKEMYAFN